MLQGFELFTAPLSEYEQNVLLPIMVRSLRVKVGQALAVKNAYICERLKEQGYEVNDARIRKLINYIRVNGLVPRLIATSRGYYVSNDRKELQDYIKSLKGREDAIREVRLAIEKQIGL